MHETPRNVRDVFTSKMPPQDIEAEESLLSAILLDNATLIDIVEGLSPSDFYKNAHAQIYDAIIDLFSGNQPIDPITVANRMQEKGTLEAIGGTAFLKNIVENVPLAVNPPQYAGIIRDKSRLRKLIEESIGIINQCYQSKGATTEIVEHAQRSIFSVTEDTGKQSFTAIGDLINMNIDTLEERQGNNSPFTGIPSGYRQVDRLTSGLQKSDLIILAARPSMGKTAFALNIARNVAVAHNVGTAVFSLEMSSEQLSMRLLTAEARIDSYRLKNGQISPEDWERVTEAAGIISEAPIFIDDTPGITPLEIRSKIRRLLMSNDIGLIVVDYLQLMRVTARGERRDLEIAEISRSLKGIAKEFRVPVIALSQLNRMLEQRADKRPMLSDLRESGSIEQDADIVAFIYRDDVYNREDTNPNKGKAEIIIAKNRNGATGTAHMTFLGQYTRFEELAPEAFSDMNRFSE
ncbi:MAG: replicative DNA helicase [Deltaproteobacteria bacterium]|nr:MAG: replicative DNA helicase [Deltaproteobacteria bacterium]